MHPKFCIAIRKLQCSWARTCQGEITAILYLYEIEGVAGLEFVYLRRSPVASARSPVEYDRYSVRSGTDEIEFIVFSISGTNQPLSVAPGNLRQNMYVHGLTKAHPPS